MSSRGGIAFALLDFSSRPQARGLRLRGCRLCVPIADGFDQAGRLGAHRRAGG